MPLQGSGWLTRRMADGEWRTFLLQEPGVQPIDVAYVDDELARLYMTSERYARLAGCAA